MEDGQLDGERVVKVLDHPARKRIIELLGTKGALPWKELAKELGMGTGSLYYHLDTLEGIISRDAGKKYELTKPGRAVFSYLQNNPLGDSRQSAQIKLESARSLDRSIEEIFAPRSLLFKMTSTTARSIGSLVILVAAVLLVMVYLGEDVRLFFLTPTTSTLNIVGSYALSLVALVAISYFATLALFHERGNLPSLAAAASLSFLPVVAFGSLLAATPLAGLLAGTSAVTVALVMFQAWSATILGAGVSVSSGVRVEKSIVVSLVVLYATMTVVFLQLRPF